MARGLLLALLALFPVAQTDAAVFVVSTGSDPLVNGDRFQTALAGAECGDTIILQAGATYATRVAFVSSSGPQGYPFGLANKGCSGQYVTIQTSALSFLPSGRVGPSDIVNMATLATNTSAPVISYADGAGWYKWIGIAFTNTSSLASAGFTARLVDTASGGYYAVGGWPHDLTYDRVIVRPYEESLSPVPNVVRSAAFGMALDGANVTLQNSWVGGFCCAQSNAPSVISQSTAVAAIGGPGPLTITNNFLEAYGWNIFTGGGGGQPQNSATLSTATSTSAILSNTTNLHVGDVIRFSYATAYTNSAGYPSNYGAATVSSISGNTITFAFFGPDSPSTAPDVPGQAAWNGVNISSITVTGNTLNKRPEWASNSGQCKSFWEMKKGSNVTFSGNTLTGPVDAAGGTACPFNTAFARNQDGSDPWAATNNNHFTSNYMPGVGDIVSSQSDPYHSTLPGDAMTFSNNLLTNIKRLDFFLTEGGSNWTVTHNTVRANTRSIMSTAGGGSTARLTFKDNIVLSGSYFFNPVSAYPSIVENHNVIVNTSGGNAPSFMSGDFVVSSDSAAGFVNVSSADSGGDYHGYALASASAFKGRASDGTDPGVNFETLDAALNPGGSGGLTAPANLTVK